jgi:hypothetical protein
MVEDWLVSDYNLMGYRGELINFAPEGDPNYDLCWVDGYPGDPNNSGLFFGIEHPRDLNDDPDENDDFVKVPPLNLNSNTVTITAWVWRNGHQRDDSAIFYCDGTGSNDGPEDQFWPGETIAGFNIGIKTDEVVSYNWPDATGKIWQWGPDIYPLPDREWAFCAMIVEPERATIYCQPFGEDLDISYETTTAYTHYPAKFEIPSTIGQHKGRNFDGVLDDLRIYDYSLNHENIRFISSNEAEGIKPPDGPFAWWRFDEGTGLIAEDSGGSGEIYFPNPSPANLYEDEPAYQRYVNFKDYTVLADNWLRDLTFPIE